jgi:curved DNA-binding protein CbpA
MDEDDFAEYLAVLNLSIDDYASLKDASFDIHKSFRKLVLTWHPDRNLHRQPEATVKFREIEEARTILLAAINEEDSSENGGDEFSSYVYTASTATDDQTQNYHSAKYLEKLERVRARAREQLQEAAMIREIENDTLSKQRINARAYHNRSLSAARYENQAYANMMRTESLKQHNIATRTNANLIHYAKRAVASRNAYSMINAQRYADVLKKRRDAVAVAVVEVERNKEDEKTNNDAQIPQPPPPPPPPPSSSSPTFTASPLSSKAPLSISSSGSTPNPLDYNRECSCLIKDEDGISKQAIMNASVDEDAHVDGGLSSALDGGNCVSNDLFNKLKCQGQGREIPL